MGSAGFSGSICTGVTYSDNSGSTSVNRKRAMPRARPTPNLNRTQGEYSPGRSDKSRPEFRAGSGSRDHAKRNFDDPPALPARLPILPWPRSADTGCRLPRRPSLPVVNREKLPCVPRRSGVDIAESSRPLNGPAET